MEENKTVEYLKDRMLSLLNSAEVIEKELLVKRKEVEDSKNNIQASANQDDVATDLEMIQKSQFSFGFLMEDFQRILAAIKEVDTLTKVLEIDLGLSSEKEKIVEMIVKSQTSIYGVKDNQVVVLDSTILDLVSKGIKTDKESLRDIFNTIVKAKLG